MEGKSPTTEQMLLMLIARMSWDRFTSIAVDMVVVVALCVGAGIYTGNWFWPVTVALVLLFLQYTKLRRVAAVIKVSSELTNRVIIENSVKEM